MVTFDLSDLIIILLYYTLPWVVVIILILIVIVKRASIKNGRDLWRRDGNKENLVISFLMDYPYWIFLSLVPLAIILSFHPAYIFIILLDFLFVVTWFIRSMVYSSYYRRSLKNTSD